MRGALLVAVPVALLAACKVDPPPPDELDVQLQAEPPHLSPLFAADAIAVAITLGDVIEPLLEVDELGRVTPVLAESYTRSPDGLEWTFTLRQGVTWHDGHAFGAPDVVHSFAQVRPSGAATPLAADFDDVTSVEAVGGRVVRVRFAGPRVDRLRSLARLPMLPAHAAPKTLLRAPLGTGPYRFAAWEPGVGIRFLRWERYWGPRPAFDKLVYRVVPDPAQSLAQLRAGKLQLIPSAPGGLVAQLGPGEPFALVSYAASSFHAVVWNCRRPPLDDEKVRTALTLLLDRESIVREIYQGRARVISGPWAPEAPATDPNLAPLRYLPDEAKALLAGRAPRLKILYLASSRADEKIATIWQDDARRAGVTLELESAPWDALLARARAGDFDGVMLSFTTAPEQDFFSHFHAGAPDNYGGFASARVDGLLEAIRTTVDDEPRRRLEHELHAALHAAQPMTFIIADTRVGVMSTRLAGVTLTVDGIAARRIGRR